jgi:hypothetical protein
VVVVTFLVLAVVFDILVIYEVPLPNPIKWQEAIFKPVAEMLLK